jgi:hypothetical protein
MTRADEHRTLTMPLPHRERVLGVTRQRINPAQTAAVSH